MSFQLIKTFDQNCSNFETLIRPSRSLRITVYPSLIMRLMFLFDVCGHAFFKKWLTFTSTSDCHSRSGLKSRKKTWVALVETVARKHLLGFPQLEKIDSVQVAGIWANVSWRYFSVFTLRPVEAGFVSPSFFLVLRLAAGLSGSTPTSRPSPHLGASRGAAIIW